MNECGCVRACVLYMTGEYTSTKWQTDEKDQRFNKVAINVRYREQETTVSHTPKKCTLCLNKI